MRRGLICFGLGIAALSRAQVFTDEQRQAVVAYWNEPNRYAVALPDDTPKSGVFKVRLTVAGSTWLWNYNRARGIAKGSPAADPAAQTPDQAEWEKWIQAKVDYDRYQAGLECAKHNAVLISTFAAPKLAAVKDPGLAPVGLVTLAGNPPRFAEAVVPVQHSIKFDDIELKYNDNVDMRPRFAYYRFERGVQSMGQRVRELPAADLERVFATAGVNASERKIMSAVSLLEGGFDSVNTYDTGFVSVGFIQFASLREGGGSLGRVLRYFRRNQPEAFETAFRRFGIDATEDGKLVAVDPDTGAELTGPEANAEIIEDKRLIAVFQRAGRLSDAFRGAQIRVARDEYLPASDVVPLAVGGVPLNLKVSDFIKSEAGMATLMDRKVNTGTLDPLPFVLSLIAGESGATKAEDFAKYERDIIVAMKFRKDYLADPTLTQPGPAKKPSRNFSQASRKGSRGARKGG